MKVTMLSGIREFTRVELSVPQVDDETVLVRVEAVAICGSDLFGYVGGRSRFGPPTVLGHELAGMVEAVGPGVTSCRVGDRVFVDSILGCGACRLCAAGRKNICPRYRVLGQGLDVPGGLAGLVAVSQTNVHVLPYDVPAAVGAVIQPLSVSYHACIEQGGVGPDDTVLVLGAGSIGDGILLAAKAVGARVVIVDPVPARLRVADQLGADVVVDPTAEDVVAAVRRETGGWGADVAFEAVGGDSDELLRQTVAATSRGGTVVTLGLKLDEGRVPINEIKSQEKTLVGSQAYREGTPARVTNEIAAGRLPVERLITHRLSFAQVDEAFALLESRADDVLKIVLEP